MRQVAAVVGGARNPGGRVCAAKPESALSPGEARRLQEVRFPDGVLVQFSQPSLSVYSYLLCSGGEALLVDPTRISGVEPICRTQVEIERVFSHHSMRILSRAPGGVHRFFPVIHSAPPGKVPS